MKRFAPVLLALALLVPPSASGFSQLGFWWDDAEVRLHIGHMNTWWEARTREAARAWNRNTLFSFEISPADLPACDRNGKLLKGVRFSYWMCFGPLFDPFVLAVAETHFDVATGEAQTFGVSFNREYHWGSYHGPVHEDIIDFDRVAIHEFGHIVGLGHEDTEPSIMNSIISEVDDIQPDDVAGVDAIYGGEGLAPLAALSTEERCQVRQLKAASRMCKKMLACDARLVKAPEADPRGDARDACRSGARTRFLIDWNGAVTSARQEGGACENQSLAQDVVPGLSPGVEALAAAVGEADPASKPDRRLRAKLMKRTAGLCASDVKAFVRAVKNDDAADVPAARDQARVSFVAKGASAISKAASAGASYDGMPPDQLADGVLDIVDDLWITVAP